jgi:tetratricopeptide (TPR) repeat protein
MDTTRELLSEAQKLEEEDRFALAIEKYKQVLETGHGDRAALLQNMGKDLARLGRLDESTMACQEASRLNPELPVPYRVLGTIHYLRREYVLAEKNLLIALRLQRYIFCMELQFCRSAW